MSVRPIVMADATERPFVDRLARALGAERIVGSALDVTTAALIRALDTDARILVASSAPPLLPGVLVGCRPLHGRAVVWLVTEEALASPAAADAFHRRLIQRCDGVLYGSADLSRRAIERWGAPRRAAVVPEVGNAGRLDSFLQQLAVDRVAAHNRRGDKVKRGIDLGAALLGLGLTWPFIAGAAAGIYATMGSPVLFRQERPGQGGAPFHLVKFRTMRHARPGEKGPDHDGDRITRLGRFLRTTSIDELPTLFNVLRGDMSLVGPRPLLMRYLERYSEEQARRHDVVPGVTGWAQVNGRNRIGWDEKFALDVWYVDNRSVALDLRILAMTVYKVLRKSDISQDDHATMPEFMGPEFAGPAVMGPGVMGTGRPT